MNDFFFRLAARSVDHCQGMEIIRPRLPSLFEAEFEIPPDLHEVSTNSEPRDLFDTYDRGGSRPGEGKTPGFGRLDGEIRTDPYGRLSGFSENGNSSPIALHDALTKKEHVSAPARFDQAFQSPEEHGMHMGNPALQQSKSVITQAPLDSMQGKDHRPDVAQKRGIEEIQQSREGAAAVSPVIEKLKLQETPPAKKGPEKRIVTNVPHAIRRIEPRSDPSEAFARRRMVSRSEPTVHVTIGRIEVRAVAAENAEKRKPKSSAMTLDEYLARRRGDRA